MLKEKMNTAQESSPIIKLDPRGGHNRYSCNFNFFNKWTDKMAYVLGFIYADGSLEDAWYLRGKYLRVTNTDYLIIKKIKKSMNSRHTIVKRSYQEKRKPLYLLRIGSHKIYHDLIQLGLHPKKSLDIQFPQIPTQYLSYFIRGYFDGDGSIVFNGKGKKWIRIVFTSGSRYFLEQLSDNLSTVLKIRKRPIRLSKRSYQLYYFTQEGFKILNFIYQNAENDKLYLDRRYKFYKKLLPRYKYILDKHITQVATYPRS